MEGGHSLPSGPMGSRMHPPSLPQNLELERHKLGPCDSFIRWRDPPWVFHISMGFSCVGGPHCITCSIDVCWPAQEEERESSGSSSSVSKQETRRHEWSLRSSGPLILVSTLLLDSQALLFPLLLWIIIRQLLLPGSSLLFTWSDIPACGCCCLPLRHVRLALPVFPSLWASSSAFSGPPDLAGFTSHSFSTASPAPTSLIRPTHPAHLCSPSHPPHQPASAFPARLPCWPVSASLALVSDHSCPPSPPSSPAVLSPADSSSRSVSNRSPVYCVLKFSRSHATSVVRPACSPYSESFHSHSRRDRYWFLPILIQLVIPILGPVPVPFDLDLLRMECFTF